MNKKIALSAICTFLVVPLFSCSGESISPSSTSPSSSSSTGEPIYLHENYRRDGNLRMGVSFSYQESSETLGYESPIALMFQADEKKRYGDDASLQIYPFRLDGEEAEKLQQAERNREVLQLLFSLSNSLLEEQEADSGLLPILADRYATPFESLEELPDETFLMNSLDGRPVFFDTIEEEGKNRLTYFEEGEQTSNPLDGFDLDTIQLNAPALLAYLDELFPEESILRPFFSTVGDLVDFLSDGLSIALEPHDENEAEVIFYLNDIGKERLINQINTMFGTSMLSLKIGEFSLSIGIFNDDVLLNQISSVDFSFKTEGLLSFGVYFDVDLGKTHQPLPLDFFDNLMAEAEGHRQTSEEALPFFDVVRDYAPFKSGVGGSESLDESKIDLSKTIESTMEQAAKDYFLLSDEAKGLLGSVFSSAANEDELTDLLLDRHQQGVDKIATLVFEHSQVGTVDDSNYRTLFDPVVSYANWEQGLTDYGADNALSDLHSYLDSRMDRIETLLSEGVSGTPFESFVQNPNSETLSTALQADEDLREIVEIPDGYLSGDREKRYETIQASYYDVLESLKTPFHTYLSSELLNADFDTLSEIEASDGVQNDHFFDRTLLSYEERSAVSASVRAEEKALEQRLLSASDSLLNLEATFLAMRLDIETLESVESTFLGSTLSAENVKEFHTQLYGILSD